MQRLAALIAFVALASGCGSVRPSSLPEQKLRLVYDDGTPAAGVYLLNQGVVLDEKNAIARCYPDGHTSWWRDVELGIQRVTGPSDASGVVTVRDGGPVDYVDPRCPLPTEYRGGYTVRWNGGEAAPDSTILPLDSFPQTLTIPRGVPVTFQAVGPLPPIEATPVVAESRDASSVTRPVWHREMNPVRSIGERRWQAYLKPGESYVLGFPQDRKPHRHGEPRPVPDYMAFATDSFVAEAGKTVSFEPGLPAQLTIKLTHDPAEMNGFPARPEVSRIITVDGKRRTISAHDDQPQFDDSGQWRSPGLAPGRYEVRFWSDKGDPYGGKTFLWTEFEIDLASGQSLVFAPQFLDEPVAPDQQAALSGVVLDNDGAPMADVAVRLTPEHPRHFGREPAHATRTDAEGRYRIEGIRRGGSYRVHVASAKDTVHDELFRAPEEATSIDREIVVYAKRGASSFDPLTLEVVDPAGGQTPIGTTRGRPVVIDVWATWCGPCLVGLPGFAETARKNADRADFFTLSIDENRSDWARKAATLDAGPRHLWFDRGRSDAQARFGIPYYFVYDASGKLVASGNDVDIEAELDKLR